MDIHLIRDIIDSVSQIVDGIKKNKDIFSVDWCHEFFTKTLFDFSLLFVRGMLDFMDIILQGFNIDILDWLHTFD